MSIKRTQELYYERGDRIIELEARLEDANRLLELCMHYLPEGCRASREVKQYRSVSTFTKED